MSGETPAPDYTKWSQSDLIARIAELEGRLNIAPVTVQAPKVPDPRKHRKFDPSRYRTRLIALKFAYLGQRYNGFEHHANNSTPLPTIEEELWKALVKTKLIFPKSLEQEDAQPAKPRKPFSRVEVNVDWEGCDYSKCGRTDRGVSAFGQVIGIRVRSNQPLEIPQSETQNDSEAGQDTHVEPKEFDSIKDELPYVQMLNSVLPDDIRVLAWCPNPPPDFSARFSCRERRYKYFFTQPAFSPVPGNDTSDGQKGWLNIEAMKEAAGYLVGLHDFRNFCKADPSKQITNFNRRIFHADIEEVSPLSLPTFVKHPHLRPSQSADEETKVYAFVIHGSAFLWHQVRHLVAIMFLIGQGVESPTLVKELLNISTNPTKPKYDMASDAPLVLWDCIFPSPGSAEQTTGYEDELDWIYIGDARGAAVSGSKKSTEAGVGVWGLGGIVDDVWEVWRGRKIDELLAATLLDIVAPKEPVCEEQKVLRRARVFTGENKAHPVGTYLPVLKRQRTEPIEIINARWAAKKGLPILKKAQQNEDEESM